MGEGGAMSENVPEDGDPVPQTQEARVTPELGEHGVVPSCKATNPNRGSSQRALTFGSLSGSVLADWKDPFHNTGLTLCGRLVSQGI